MEGKKCHRKWIKGVTKQEQTVCPREPGEFGTMQIISLTYNCSCFSSPYQIWKLTIEKTG